ncbi:MAG: hypothetical protein KAS96_10155 [Planctomycetes bacterium]|nr:hypothetical protein [Planctomycetota bacterium]
MNYDEKNIPEIVTINKLCSLMGISRSRYYQILSEGLILPPIYAPNSKRPYYTREMALRNLQVKRDSLGVNNKICMFYNKTKPTIISVTKNKKSKIKDENKYQDLIDGLEALGLSGIKSAQVQEAANKLYPDGTKNVSESEVLKKVFCIISAQNSTDNLNR